jgi:hypothetical protein
MLFSLVLITIFLAFLTFIAGPFLFVILTLSKIILTFPLVFTSIDPFSNVPDKTYMPSLVITKLLSNSISLVS